MDALFRLGKASAADVRGSMPEPPSYSAVRTTLRILEEKGAVRHEEAEGKYLYTAALSRDAARSSALRSLLDTFFEGSATQAAVAMLGSARKRLTQDEIARLSEILEEAKRRSGL
jgi:predicted transcriptional regulator